MNLKKIALIISSGAAVAVLSGCSSTSAQRCPIDQDGYPTCLSMEKVFDHAYSEDGDHLSVVPKTEESTDSSDDIFTSSESKSVAVKGNVQHRELSPVVEHPYKNKPVYVPEKLHRVTFAPWTDSNNNLHSAEQVYFTTKGYWNYGTLNNAGAMGNGMMEPLAPTDVGFEPDYTKPKSQTEHVQPELTIFGK